MYLPPNPPRAGARIARDPDLSGRRFEVIGFSHRAAGLICGAGIGKPVTVPLIEKFLPSR